MSRDISTMEALAPLSDDDRKLGELGYKAEFNREMGWMAVIGISFTAIGILTGMSSAFQTGLFSGGPLGLWWGWQVVSVFMFAIALCLAEICSAFPTAGGLYYWCCKLKPDVPALGYISGNLYVWAMVFTGTSGNLSVALYIASLIEMGTGNHLSRVKIAALAWGVNIFSGIVNTIGTRAIGAVSSFNVWFTLAGTVILTVVLLVKAPVKNTAHFAFLDYENFTGWSNSGLVVLLGFLQAVYSLEGCETAAQVAEETVNAAWMAPVSIAASVAGSWLLGTIYMLALLFSVQSIPSIQQTTFAIPISQLYYDAVGQKLAIFCVTIIMICQLCATLTCFTASSRLFYALARDNAIPFQATFMSLNSTRVPWAGVWLSVVVGCAISAAYIGSTVAFGAILSSAAIAVMMAYGLPIMCRVFWPDTLGERGPFHLGKYSWGINVASLAFIAFVSILFVLPTSRPVTALNMNYAVCAVGGVLILVGLQYLFHGRHVFVGPILTVDRASVAIGDDKAEDKVEL